jgi:hypothetical protein
VVYVIDTARLDPARVDEYVRLIEQSAVPVMTEAGAGFVSCLATSRELGEDVEVQVTWSCEDHVEWNEIRKNMVLDPRWHQLARREADLRNGGHRRFYYPAGTSSC